MINGYPVYKKENVEKGYIKGFETVIDYQLVHAGVLKETSHKPMGKA